MSLISDQPRLLPTVMMTGVIALDDAPSLPELNLVQELTAQDSDFAYEQLIKVVGGQAFFGASASVFSSTLSPFGISYHSAFSFVIS